MLHRVFIFYLLSFSFFSCFFLTKQSTTMYIILDTKISIVSNICVSELEVVNPRHWSFLMANVKK